MQLKMRNVSVSIISAALLVIEFIRIRFVMTKKIVIILLLLLLNACGNPGSKNDAAGHSETGVITDSSKDYFQDKVQVLHARHFSVRYHDNYKIVKTDATFYPQGKEEVGEDQKDLLVLVQKGTQAPVLEGDLQGATIISIPVYNVAVNIQHSESFLRELGLADRITAIGGLYSYNDEMRTKALNGDLGHVGYSWHGPPNLEVLLERKPDLFLMTLASMAHTESLEKCRTLEIPTAAVFDWAEQDYLARAEWIKFYSLFFNAEQEANRVFQEIADRIAQLKAITAQVPQETAMWGYYTSKSRWLVQLSNFPAQYMRDANLKNVLLGHIKPNANGVESLSSEQLLLYGKEAEHWIIGDIHASPLPKETIMSSFQAWNSRHLYHNMKRVDPKSNTSDWYATAIVRPDTVLADLVRLVHPELLSGHQPVFMDIFKKDSRLN